MLDRMAEDYTQIDLSYLEGIAEGDKDIIKELVEIFLDQMPEFTDGFAESMRDKDWVKVAAIAHKAKSSVMSMGMEELGNVDLKNMELLAKQLRINELSDKESVTDAQKDEVNTLQRSLDSYPENRITWVVDNASKDKLEELINKFTAVCNIAVEELNKEISTY